MPIDPPINPIYWRGAVSQVPLPQEKRFRFSLAVFFHKKYAVPSPDIWAFVQKFDRELSDLILRNEMESADIRVFIGEPESNLKDFLENNGPAFRKAHMTWLGFLVFERGPILQGRLSEKDLDELTPSLIMSPSILKLYNHLRVQYVRPITPP